MTVELTVGDDVSEARLVAAHASIGARDTVIAERRSIYGIAAREASVPIEDLAILDSPIARGAVGRSIGGADPIEPSQLVSLKPLSTVVGSGNLSVAIGTDPHLVSLLANALALIGGLAGTEQPLVPLALGDCILDDALCIATEGVALAGRVIPTLIDDLLPHIGLVALFEPSSAGNLGSASVREFPGLVVVPAPMSAIQLAEAIVHEGAHQKLFDLAITHDLYGHAANRCSTYCPPWSPSDTAWPLEQVLAAWHAYTCLSVFNAFLADTMRAELDWSSLLPVAASRSEVLLEQLLKCGGFLGGDAHRLIKAVTDTAPADPPPADSSSQSVDGLVREPVTGSGRVLAYLPGSSPLQLFWLAASCDIRAIKPA